MAFLGLFVTSCQKDKPLETDAVNASDDASFSEILFDDVFTSLEIATMIAESSTKNMTVNDSCPLVTVTFPEGELWPRSVEINYGTGCTGIDNIVRSGKINITLTGPRKTTGSERSISFADYYCNGVKIEGTHTVENLGPNSSENVVFGVSLTDGKITFPDATVIEREFQREREYISGYNTINPWDDVCMITGNASGVTYLGQAYNHTITNALRWEATCRFIVSGTIRFELEGIDPFELDYGDGDCDAKATLIRGDHTKEILLRLWHPKIQFIN